MKRFVKFLSVTLMAMAVFVGCQKEKNIIISVTSNNEAYGTVTGTGAYAEGETVTLTATPNEGYKFLSWNDGNTDNPRTFKAAKSEVFTAQFGAMPQGDGKCYVTWQGNRWEAKGIYLESYHPQDDAVTLSIYKDPADTTQPMVVCIFPRRTGNFQMVQGGTDLAFLYYDYPGQVGVYEGQEMPPYQAIQDVSMKITAIDPIAGIVEARMSGQFINLENYISNPSNPDIYNMTIEFNACQWTDVSE